jgi:tRNA A37 N6-isopentenylltransferase MiaA
MIKSRRMRGMGHAREKTEVACRLCWETLKERDHLIMILNTGEEGRRNVKQKLENHFSTFFRKEVHQEFYLEFRKLKVYRHSEVSQISLLHFIGARHIVRWLKQHTDYNEALVMTYEGKNNFCKRLYASKLSSECIRLAMKKLARLDIA